MNKLLLLVLILFVGCKSTGEFHYFHSEEYYDEFHLQQGGSLYAYTNDYKSYEVNTEDLFNSYLDVEVLNIDRNLRRFKIDEEGIYLSINKERDSIPRGLVYRMVRVSPNSICQKKMFFDYAIITLVDLDGGIVHNQESRLEVLKRLKKPEDVTEYEIEEYEFDLRYDTIPHGLFDTIRIVRNAPKEESISTLNEDAEKPYYSDDSKSFEIIELVTLDKSNPNSERFMDLLINVQIELKEGDLYSESEPLLRGIFNSHWITNKLIQTLSMRLQELGYLTTSTNNYIPYIKNAIHKLQLDHKLPTGFLDDDTFEVLKLDYEDSRCKFENGKPVICFPGRINASFG